MWNHLRLEDLFFARPSLAGTQRVHVAIWYILCLEVGIWEPLWEISPLNPKP